MLSENKEDIGTYKGIISDLEKGITTIENFSLALNSNQINDQHLISAANDFSATVVSTLFLHLPLQLLITFLAQVT